MGGGEDAMRSVSEHEERFDGTIPHGRWKDRQIAASQSCACVDPEELSFGLELLLNRLALR